MKKRIMVIGPKQCGKTSIVNYINGYEGPLRKSQDTIYTKDTLDVPSGYLEQPWMNKYIISLAQDAWCILVVIDQNDVTEIYSPGFAKALQCKNIVGVISKSDLKPENNEICRQQLKKIGVKEPYFNININDKEGMKKLKIYLEKLKKEV